MKKNIYLIIITIITVVCIIAGSLYHIGGFALGLFDNLIPRSDKSLGNVCTEELSVDEFSNLVFDTTISNINVKTGDSYMVSYKCNKRLVPKIKSSGDTLTISQSKGANYRRNTTSEITVTIPEGATLNKLSLDTGVGEVNLNSLTAADAEFDTGVGDLYVTDCSFATCDVDGGTGNLLFDNSERLFSGIFQAFVRYMCFTHKTPSCFPLFYYIITARIVHAPILRRGKGRRLF